MARFLDIRDATISEWKRNRCTPSVSVICKIAEFLGVSVDYLVAGKEYAPSPSQTTNGNSPLELSEIEGELLKVCASLDIRRKNALLTYAYKLENEMLED